MNLTEYFSGPRLNYFGSSSWGYVPCTRFIHSSSSQHTLLFTSAVLLHTLLFTAPVLVSTMPGFISSGRFAAEMLLCDESYKAFIVGEPVSWYESEDKEVYRCNGPDPRTFPRRQGVEKSDLPFKYIGDTEDDHFFAAEGYARALRKGIVTGNPRYLLQVSMSIEDFLKHLADGDIVVYAGQHTVGFLKHLTVDHYPGITLFGGEVRDDEGAFMSEQVYDKMTNLRK